MKTFKRFPSIEQFRSVVKQVKDTSSYVGQDEEGKPIFDYTRKLPTITFTGTVKLHGTNAGIVKYSDGRLEFQSRERVLTLDYDNAGFMQQMMSADLSFLFSNFKFSDYSEAHLTAEQASNAYEQQLFGANLTGNDGLSVQLSAILAPILDGFKLSAIAHCQQLIQLVGVLNDSDGRAAIAQNVLTRIGRVR